MVDDEPDGRSPDPDCAECLRSVTSVEAEESSGGGSLRDPHQEAEMAASPSSNQGASSSNKSVSFKGQDAPSTSSLSPATNTDFRPAGPPSFATVSRTSPRLADPYTSSLAPTSLLGPLPPASASSHREPGSSRSPNVPLPSPSAVHINQSLEESLRRAEEERQRRSQERRFLRRKRKVQQRNVQQPPQQPVSGGIFIPGKDGSALTQDADSTQQESTLNSASQTSRLPLVDEVPLAEEDHAGRADSGPALEDEDNEEDDEDSYSEGDYSDDTEDENGRSLTRQLAETAVSVREMSRELGRVRVKSNISSVLIVTKARDNQLIKLTREIAIYLMKTPRNGRSKGLNVYVDAQLKKSKRFDAAGIERENPELFRSASSATHHHHHHHGTHSGHGSREGSSSGPSRRNSSRRQSSTASSLNLLGMTAANHSGLSSSNGYSSTSSFSHGNTTSATTSGANTPALMSSSTGNLGKPLTKLTEALVSRQLDRQLERENQRRDRENAEGLNGAGRTHASGPGTPNAATASNGKQARSGAQTPMSPGSASNSGRERDGTEDQQGQLRYWTAEMCSKSPHLFDLVVTVGILTGLTNID